jgi:hypothetical protein
MATVARRMPTHRPVLMHRRPAAAGTVDFTLTSVSGDTATGTITAASNPKDPIGGPVTIKLVGGGQGLQRSVAGGDQGFPFCNSNDNFDASHDYFGG